MKTINLSETQLISLIKESVEKVLLCEMAYPRNQYKEKLDNLMPQILTNWCLVHYCTITNTHEELKQHWQSELRGHLFTVARYSIKNNDTPEKRLKVLNEIWEENEYLNPNNLNLTVCNKFIDENIDINTNEYFNTIKDCIINTQLIFNTILSKNKDIIIDYVNSI